VQERFLSIIQVLTVSDFKDLVSVYIELNRNKSGKTQAEQSANYLKLKFQPESKISNELGMKDKGKSSTSEFKRPDSQAN
jgi:hypothetical protein